MEFTVPGYRVEELLGAGSHAEVWSARVVATGEPVALKRIALPDSGDPDRYAELVAVARSEAALLTALEHPGLIRLYRYVQTPTAAVLVMELAAGGSLAQLLRRRERLTPAEVAAALGPVAAALAFAHDEGVLHGDISTGNILFTSAGRAKLSDLGVARMAFGGPSDRVLGTPAYLDPVVAAGGTTGQSSDVFSLAAVALHCLTGAGPWQPNGQVDLPALLARAATGVIDGLDERLADCPPPMAAVVRRALDPEPYRRGTAAEFALDLGASVPPGSVVLAAGRIPPRVGRHSVDQHAPAATDAVPVDLTQVARLQVRPEASALRPVRRRGWRRWTEDRQRNRRDQSGRQGGSQSGRQSADRASRPGAGQPSRQDAGQPGRRGADRASRPGAGQRSQQDAGRPGRRGADRPSRHGASQPSRRDRNGGRGWRPPGRRFVLAVLAIVTVLAGTVAADAVRSRSRPSRVDGSGQPRATSSGPAAAESPGARPGPLATGTRGASAPATSPAGPAGQAAPGTSQVRVDPMTVLRRLADRRAAAFAANRPELLATVYESPVLLAEDAALLGARIPAGCGLAGVQTSYTDVAVTRDTGQRIEVRVTANQPPATLMCQGAVRGRTTAAAPARLAVTLLKVGADFRIAAQQVAP